MALTNQRKIFVEGYLATWNASEAARRAGYAHPGSEGHRLLKNAEIQEEIQQRLADRVMSADEVLVRLAEQARNEHGKYITSTGIVNLPQLVADGKGHLIKGIKETQWGKNIEFYDAQAALVQIGRHHKLFTDVSESKSEVEIVDATDARERIIRRIAGIAERQTESGDTE